MLKIQDVGMGPMWPQFPDFIILIGKQKLTVTWSETACRT